MTMRLLRYSIGAWLAAGVFAMVVVAEEGASKATPLQITVGDTATLQLDGNPSTGYTWVLQDAPRESREFVTVDVLGYVKPELKPGERPLLGGGQKFQVLVTGIEAGRALLVFNYVKGGTPAPARSQQFAIEVLDDGTPDTLTDELPEDSRRDLFADPDGEQDGGGNDK